MRAREHPDRPVGHDGHSPVPLFADDHSEEEWETYLDALRDGITPDLAARTIKLTGTRMSRYLKREPEREREAAEAMVEGQQHYSERLRATARVVALRTAPSEVNARILEVELAAHGGPEYAHLRRDRVKHEGTIEHALVLDASRLDSLPLDELMAVREALAKLAAHEVIEQGPRELTA